MTKFPSSAPLLNSPKKYVSKVKYSKQGPVNWSFLNFPTIKDESSRIVIPNPSLLFCERKYPSWMLFLKWFRWILPYVSYLTFFSTCILFYYFFCIYFFLFYHTYFIFFKIIDIHHVSSFRYAFVLVLYRTLRLLLDGVGIAPYIRS